MRSIVVRLLSIVYLTYFSFVLPTQAQDADSEQLKKYLSSDRYRQFQKYILSERYRVLVANAFSHLPREVFHRCPTLVSEGIKAIIIQPVSFGAHGVPNAGRWQGTFPIRGCGNDTTHNVYFSATKNEKVNITFAVPGESRADLTLQNDAIRYAQIGAAVAAKTTCDTFNVKNTKFDGLDSANGKTRSWRETWTMVGCNRTFDVPLTFTPSDRGGTDIHQNTGAIVERH
jgi:hypothetical protein